MGNYNVVVISYKHGLLKKLFDEEQKKQYLDSQIDDGKYHKNTEFCRGSGYQYYFESLDSDEDNYIVKYKFHIKTEDYLKDNKVYLKNHRIQTIGCGHQFIYYPEFRKLCVFGVGGRYNFSKEGEHEKNLIKYFTNLLEEICPVEDQWDKKWNVQITGDEYINEDYMSIDDYGDELTDDEILYEIPELLRTPIEQSRVLALYGNPESTDNTIEDAIFSNKYEDVEKFIKEETDTVKLQELFYVVCKHKYTNLAVIFIKFGVNVDNKALSIAVKNNDMNTAKLLLVSNKELKPYNDDIAEAAHSWKNEECERYLFDMLLQYYIKN
jgi:hypothetical protein